MYIFHNSITEQFRSLRLRFVRQSVFLKTTGVPLTQRLHAGTKARQQNIFP